MLRLGLACCRYYADLAGEEAFHNNKTLIYLAGKRLLPSGRRTCDISLTDLLVRAVGSASAEFFADIGLCPLEAVKVTSLACCCLQWLPSSV